MCDVKEQHFLHVPLDPQTFGTDLQGLRQQPNPFFVSSGQTVVVEWWLSEASTIPNLFIKADYDSPIPGGFVLKGAHLTLQSGDGSPLQGE